MADPTKLVGSEITLTTANTVRNASLVRVVNLDATNTALVTQKSNTGTTIGTLTLGNASSNYCNEFIMKDPNDTLEITGVATIKAAPVAFR